MNKRRCRMSSCELVTLVTAIACNIANCYSEEEVELLAAVFAQLGDTLATIQVRESALSANDSEDEEESSCDNTEEDSSEDSDKETNKNSGRNSSGSSDKDSNIDSNKNNNNCSDNDSNENSD